jgi:hypothetical protein
VRSCLGLCSEQLAQHHGSVESLSFGLNVPNFLGPGGPSFGMRGYALQGLNKLIQGIQNQKKDATLLRFMLGGHRLL